MVCLCVMLFFFFFKQKTAYEMRISDWSSDVCSSDLAAGGLRQVAQSDRRAQFTQQRLRMGFTQAPGAVAQQALDLLRLGHQRLVALAQRRDFRIDALEQALLGIAPADALLELAPHRCRFVRTGECLVELEDQKSTRLNSSH